jgi:Ca2+-binding RTX toxin-like protein
MHGADAIFGNVGNDTLTGGLGNDRFVWDGTSNDVITDFETDGGSGSYDDAN